MFYPKTDFCPFNSDNPDYAPLRDGADCPLNERELMRSEMENPPTHDTECEMMKQIQEIGFAVVDLNLFLDTHPDCTQALELYTKLAATLKSLKNDYQSRFGPLYATDSNKDTPFDWVEQGRKWPWEI